MGADAVELVPGCGGRGGEEAALLASEAGSSSRVDGEPAAAGLHASEIRAGTTGVSAGVGAPSERGPLARRPPASRQGATRLSWRRRLLLGLGLGALASAVCGTAAGLAAACWLGDCLAAGGVARSAHLAATTSGSTALRPIGAAEPVSRIAFGSCTSYDSYTPQGVWTRGVLPYRPHAWIWLGDMAYTDEPAFDCHGQPDAPACKCGADFLRSPPYSCLAGDPDNARDKFAAQMGQPGYRDLLEYMCPGAGVRDGVTPPGDEPSRCPRHVLGTYDDHDAGWNNGNARLPLKHQMKNLFLDALGAAPGSPRRSALRGLEWRYRLNAGLPGKAVDVILLDERYYRDTLPCDARWRWCKDVVLGKRSGYGRADRAWCQDFIRDPGPRGESGSCCRADEAADRGCRRADARSRLGEETWQLVCNVTAPGFGTVGFALAGDGGLDALPGKDGPEIGSSKPRGAPRWGTLDPKAVVYRAGACDVLGPTQRAWLDRQLAESAGAALTLIGSSSVVLGNPNRDNSEQGWDALCSGDDWDCYPRAQRSLLSALQRAPGGGCVVILTGDYHQSDIKVLAAGRGGTVDHRWGSASLRRNTYQVMASGLTNSTARPGTECRSWRQDHASLRPGGRCAYVSRPAFGSITLDWGARTASLELRDALHGEAPLQGLKISLDTCQVLGYEHRDL